MLRGSPAASTVALTFHTGRELHGSRTSIDPVPMTGSAAVLVVEDDPLIASFVTRALGASGFAVEWVATAGEGLERLGLGDIAVAVLDLNLPDMDGLELLRTLRTDHPCGRDLPVVIITARNDPADRELARSLGVQTYLRKPFALGELLSAVRAAAGLETSS